MVLNPPLAPSQHHDQWAISLNIALTLEEIWRIKNAALFNKSMPDIQQSISLIHHRLKEASLVLDVCSPSVPNPLPSPLLSWSPPPPSWIKINTDAALSSSKVSLAVLARDHNGVPINAWARISKNLSPIQAEAEALLWAVKLAKSESWYHIIFEGDAKGVFDSLTSKKAPQTGPSVLPSPIF